MTTARYTDLQLDALRELANIGSGTAGTALSSLLERPVVISVPNAAALELADAVEAAGDPEDVVWAIAVTVHGNIDATALLLISEDNASTICAMLGALATMTGFELALRPPVSARDMLGAVVASVLAARSDGHDLAIMLDSELEVEGEACALSFMLLPTPEGVDELLHRIGLGA
jgi:chemotaxis protein CheC